MNCSQFEEFASLYIDEMLTEEEMIKFKRHLETCESCYISLENLKTIVSTVNEMEEVDLPTDFTLSLRQKLQEEKNRSQTKRKYPIKWKIASGIAAGLMITAISLTALEGLLPQMMSTRDLSMEMKAMDLYGDAEMSAEAAPAGRGLESNQNLTPAPPVASSRFTTDGATNKDTEEVQVSMTESADAQASIATENRKIINRGRLAIETLAFDEVYEETYRLVDKYGGYFQHSETQYHLLNREKPEESLRSAYLVIRVPSQHFKEIFQDLKGLGVVINDNTNAEDVTLTYRDVENEVLNLEIQEERLREILQKAEKVEDILRIENELSRVRLQINSMKGTLKNYDQLISLSTIQMDLTEVKEITEPAVKLQTVEKGITSRGKDNFIKSVNQMINFGERALINLFGLIPWAALIAIITLPVVGIVNKLLKKRRGNNIEK